MVSYYDEVLSKTSSSSTEQAHSTEIIIKILIVTYN